MMQTTERYVVGAALTAALGVLAGADVAHAHAGPPFPIVSNQVVGAYQISIWTDPDATDDGTAEGQFWVIVEPSQKGATIPAGTRATISIRPLDRDGPERTGRAEPVGRQVSPQFVALVMDHEGPFAVHVAVDGPLGTAEVKSEVEATYDLRPPPILLAVYVVPFLLVGFLWLKLLLARRRRRNEGAIH